MMDEIIGSNQSNMDFISHDFRDFILRNLTSDRFNFLSSMYLYSAWDCSRPTKIRNGARLANGLPVNTKIKNCKINVILMCCIYGIAYPYSGSISSTFRSNRLMFTTHLEFVTFTSSAVLPAGIVKLFAPVSMIVSDPSEIIISLLSVVI